LPSLSVSLHRPSDNSKLLGGSLKETALYFRKKSVPPFAVSNLVKHLCNSKIAYHFKVRHPISFISESYLIFLVLFQFLPFHVFCLHNYL
jgi:hypothetical protein